MRIYMKQNLLFLFTIFVFISSFGCQSSPPLTKDEINFAKGAAKEGWITEEEQLTIVRMRKTLEVDKKISDADLSICLSIVDNKPNGAAKNSSMIQVLSSVKEWTESQKNLVIDKSKERLSVQKSQGKYTVEGQAILWLLASTKRKDALDIVQYYADSNITPISETAKIVMSKSN
jgi:hypothetical protein